MYGMLSFHQIANYLSRLVVPYLVPFMVADFRFSEPQRAALLGCFTPGYVVTQIPSGWFAARFGAKALVAANCAGIAGLMMLLPAAAASGFPAAAACLVSLGMVQGGFSVGQNMMKAQWLPRGAERAWALLVIGYGTTLSKNLASLATPWLAAVFGWRTAARVYATGALVYAAVWLLLAREHPTPAAAARAKAATATIEAATAVEGAVDVGGMGQTQAARQPHSLWALLAAPPHLANVSAVITVSSDCRVLQFHAHVDCLRPRMLSTGRR